MILVGNQKYEDMRLLCIGWELGIHKHLNGRGLGMVASRDLVAHNASAQNSYSHHYHHLLLHVLLVVIQYRQRDGHIMFCVGD